MAEEKDTEYAARFEKVLEDLLFEASDEEILQDARAVGEDPEAVAAQVRENMAKVVARFRKNRLEQKREQYERELAQYRKRTASRIPSDPAERRILLGRLVQEQPRLTAQFRELDRMTDADVLTALQDLAALLDETGNDD